MAAFTDAINCASVGVWAQRSSASKPANTKTAIDRDFILFSTSVRNGR